MVVKIFELTINEECGAGMETFLHGSQKVQQKCLQILNKGTVIDTTYSVGLSSFNLSSYFIG